MIGLFNAVALNGAAATLRRFAPGNRGSAHVPQRFCGAPLAVNLVGCLLIGYLYGLFLIRPEVPLVLRAGLVVGVLGGLTTFSSFSLDTLRLLESGQAPLALVHAPASVLGSLLAT